MADSYRLVGISGALRRESTNTKLLHEAIRAFGPCDFTQGDIRMPLFDEDLEIAQGVAPEAHALADRIVAADALVICTPEYNRNPPGVLKNALDWLSRTKKAPLTGKPLAILSAADGFGGGMRSQFALRHMLTPFNPRILQGPEVVLPDSRNAFDDQGRLTNKLALANVEKLMAALKAEIDLLRLRP
ncbi:NAD(P)H-dependent oxidoreductase [Halovulum dunhuangense]|uniref:NAD(P)H-dependent oxidoreductase n=1 Tax=Halovulum dunhuangense TaxID=1505036 RepID=A0A849KZF3_9RHOB|nr:NAD(P)H-dependent oxidoreductase [Halovulum dunhuangense]NNU79552.1 NAD(P)H-dependent oxidoreductase [Halovulum dunhuangense]